MTHTHNKTHEKQHNLVLESLLNPPYKTITLQLIHLNVMITWGWTHLGWGADLVGTQSAGRLVLLGVVLHGEAARLITVLLPATVTLLTNLHHSIATYGLLWLSKAALGVSRL